MNVTFERASEADAETLVDCVEVSWSEAALATLMSRHSQVAINFIRIIGRRLQEAQERMRELATQRVEQRIANTLLRLSRRAGRATAEGTTIDLPLRRKDIADICGTTLHSASRILTPLFGSDIYTWATIISIVVAGLMAG